MDHEALIDLMRNITPGSSRPRYTIEYDGDDLLHHEAVMGPRRLRGPLAIPPSILGELVSRRLITDRAPFYTLDWAALR